MEKKNNNCPIVMCEKLYKKVTVSPAFQTIRRISYRMQPTKYAGSDNSSPSMAIQSKPAQHPKSGDGSLLYNTSREAAGGMVPIHLEYSNQPPVQRIPHNIQVIKITHRNEPAVTPGHEVFKSNPKQKPQGEMLGEGGKSGVHIEDRVTKYLNRAKDKLRRTISYYPGDGKINATGSGNDKLANNGVPVPVPAGKDKITDYIERTKKKLRTASNVGVGK